MSLLRSTNEDFGGGRPLPNGEWSVTVEDATVEHRSDTEERFNRTYGQITTPNGETELPSVNGQPAFRIGNRKLFVHSWIRHPNEQAQRIGNGEITKEGYAASLIERPKRGEHVETDINEEYAESLRGRRFLVRTQQRPNYTVRQGMEAELGRRPQAAELRAKVAELRGDDVEAVVVGWRRP